MSRAFWCAILIFLSFGAEARELPFIVGELHGIDPISERGEAMIYDRELLKDMPKRLHVFNPELDSIAIFDVSARKRLNGKTIITGKFRAGKQTLYMGLKVGYLIKPLSEPMLPNRVPRAQQRPGQLHHKEDGSQMIFIPRGPFVLGKDGAGVLGKSYYTSANDLGLTKVEITAGEKRVHFIEVGDYYIDKTEITVRQFARFLSQTGIKPPPEWNWQAEGTLPVAKVSYDQARGYCEWANKRLPNELEWEKAARGTGLQRRRARTNEQTGAPCFKASATCKDKETFYYVKNEQDYPMADGFDSNKCITLESKRKAPLKVTELEDDSPFGLKGMCGNVAEWTSSWLLPYRGNSYHKAPPSLRAMYGRQFKVIRGGAYDLPRKWAKSYERLPGGTPTLSKDFRAGFRCVKDAS